MVTFSATRRPTDKYTIELIGFKRIPFYVNKVQTPKGVEEPKINHLVHPIIHVEKEPQPTEFLGAPITEDTIRFIALYHKLDPIPRKRTLIITSPQNRESILQEFIDACEKIIPGKYYVRKHRGKNAVFIMNQGIINEIKNVLGDRYSKKYPTWIVNSEYEGLFIRERIAGITMNRSNSVEITSSSVNNETFLSMLLNQGYYVNARAINHSTAKNRSLWYFTLYPTRKEHLETIGIDIPLRKKGIIDGKQYYTVKNVTPL